jgi:stress response protein YsnF
MAERKEASSSESSRRMHGENVVAIFSSRLQAEAARSRLLDSGIADADIRLSADRQASAETSTVAPKHEDGFLDWLFGTHIPEDHQTWYGSNLRDGRTALSVYLRGDSSLRVHDILEEFDPVDVEKEGLAPMSQPGIEGSSTGTSQRSTPPGDLQAAGNESAQVIPVAKEELEIGKRETERRYRIRTYVVERPVEEQVHLRDERVVIERRPVSGESVSGDQEFQEREFEVVERHEEPVVAKKARVVEEVIVHKEAKDRAENVRDRVRETKVDVDEGIASAEKANVGVDRAAAGNKPAAAAGSMGAESDRRIGQRISNKAKEIKEDVKDIIAPDRKI